MDLVQKAKEFATKAHGAQMRYNGLLYITNPEEVANLVQASGGSDLEIAAGWLHDTVEDTPVTFNDIEREFGEQIVELVRGLTDLPEWENLTMPNRKAKQAERIKSENQSIRRVKLADQISNVRLCGIEGIEKVFHDKEEYTLAAKKIADECRNISEFLDAEFHEAFQKVFANQSA
jgi:(p)ppGpp synthase/HD superfamily hydrolase